MQVLKIKLNLFLHIFYIFIDTTVLKVHSLPDQVLILVSVLLIFSDCNENAIDSLTRKSKTSSITFYLLKYSLRNGTR